MAVRKTTRAASVNTIRLRMTYPPLSRRVVELDAAVFDQLAGRARQLGARRPVVREGRDLVEPGPGQVVLPRENQEVGGESGVVPVALGGQLHLRRLAPRARGLDALPGGFHGRRRVQD